MPLIIELDPQKRLQAAFDRIAKSEREAELLRAERVVRYLADRWELPEARVYWRCVECSQNRAAKIKSICSVCNIKYEIRDRELRKQQRRAPRIRTTNTPCTARCWNAVEPDCACSCGGKNHGIGHKPEGSNGS